MGLKINGIPVAGLGLPGKSAYQSAVDGGYQGTEQEFNEFLATMKSSVNADWNQNDETQADYVKNRTHYTYYEKKVLYEGIDLQMIDAGYIIGSYRYLQAGQIYTITFRDTVYECVAWEHNGRVYAGSSAVIANPGIWGYDSTISADSHDNGEPFCMLTTGYTLCMDYEYKNYIKVEGLVPSYKTIDIKYLPEEVTAQADWNQNDKTAGDYIKNRPFYDIITYEPIVQDLTVTTITDRNYTNLEVEYNFELGSLYEVVINGVTYTNLVASEIYDTMSYIGTNLEELGEGSKPPFCVLSNEGWLQLYVLAEGEYTVSINKKQSNIHYLDSKYIKDMYCTELVSVTLIEEQTVTTVTEGDIAYGKMSGAATLVVGETYKVLFNGITYECVAYEYADWNAVCIGNGSIIGATGGKGEPFCIDNYSNNDSYLNTDDTGTYIVSVSHKLGENIHQIDPKYIPSISSLLETNKGLEQKFWRGKKSSMLLKPRTRTLCTSSLMKITLNQLKILAVS